jgi:hypothetical protein
LFALSAIRTADAAVDKFAKMDGSYVKDKIPPPIRLSAEQLSCELFAYLLEKIPGKLKNRLKSRDIYK